MPEQQLTESGLYWAAFWTLHRAINETVPATVIVYYSSDTQEFEILGDDRTIPYDEFIQNHEGVKFVHALPPDRTKLEPAPPAKIEELKQQLEKVKAQREVLNNPQ